MEYSKKLTVFVVDDDPLYRTYLAKHLQKELNIDLELYDSAELCMDALKKRPDLIILDYFLDSEETGNKSGWEALMLIKRCEPDVPVIMLSSAPNIEYMMDCIKFGAEDYIIKSAYTIQRIKTIMNELFEHKSWSWM